jgi:hypothetical protein
VAAGDPEQFHVIEELQGHLPLATLPASGHGLFSREKMWAKNLGNLRKNAEHCCSVEPKSLAKWSTHFHAINDSIYIYIFT